MACGLHDTWCILSSLMFGSFCRRRLTCSPAVGPDRGTNPPRRMHKCCASLGVTGGCRLQCAESSFAAMASASLPVPLGYACTTCKQEPLSWTQQPDYHSQTATNKSPAISHYSDFFIEMIKQHCTVSCSWNCMMRSCRRRPYLHDYPGAPSWPSLYPPAGQQ